MATSLDQRLYMYPKSSCTCYQCTTNKYEFPTGKPTNLSVRSCKVSDYYDCKNRRVFDNAHMEPQDKNGIEWINPNVYAESYSKSFGMIDCKEDAKDPCNTCPEPQFVSWDPRTWSATHNQYLTFDRPPLETAPKLKDIYNKDLKGYGQGYGTYSDITAGNIIYYNDKSREDAYYDPLFAHPAQVNTVLYKDPMGAMKPEYPRTVDYKNPVSDTDCDYGEYCLSFIKDTQMHREDILSGIMTQKNQQRWMPRWANLNK